LTAAAPPSATNAEAAITAPATANYYFWIAGSDSAELWISNDNEPNNKVRRAVVNPATPTAIPGTVTDSGTAAQPARRVRGTRTAGRGRRGAAKQVEPKAATKRGAAKAGRAAKATSGGERAYRRAPADLVQVFGELGGVTAVARHYGVPRYTAQSWIRRLRNEGQLPAR